MEQRSDYLELTIISAADLQRKWLSGDRTVAVAWVDPLAKKTTSIVSSNGSSVQWDDKLILTLNGVDTSLQSKLLTVEIRARGAWGDSLLGSVYVPLVELVLDGETKGNTILMYEIVQPSGKRQGSMKFLAKVVKPTVSDSVIPLPSAPPILPREEDGYGLGSNALYPPADAMCPVETDDERFSSEANLCYPTLEVSVYPPHVSENYVAGHDAQQQDKLPDPSYGMVAYPPHVYPPVYTAYAPHTSLPYTGMIPYPPPSLPGLETPYLPPASVYPPPMLFSETPYPPIASHPPYPHIAPYPSEIYPPASFNPYSSPLPPYPLQQATFVYPHPSYWDRSF